MQPWLRGPQPWSQAAPVRQRALCSPLAAWALLGTLTWAEHYSPSLTAPTSAPPSQGSLHALPPGTRDHWHRGPKSSVGGRGSAGAAPGPLIHCLPLSPSARRAGLTACPDVHRFAVRLLAQDLGGQVARGAREPWREGQGGCEGLAAERPLPARPPACQPAGSLPNHACWSPCTSMARPKSASFTAAPLHLLARSRFSGCGNPGGRNRGTVWQVGGGPDPQAQHH